MTYNADQTFYGINTIHRRGDANLTAAAPDLLAVARMVAEAAELAGISGPLGDAARAAIAKATQP